MARRLDQICYAADSDVVVAGRRRTPGTRQRAYCRTNDWCRRFDVESPKGSIDGSQVARAYRDGRIEDIGEYCLRDVRATAQLYKKLENTLLPLFRGGPSA